jgi:hypothetical protein
LLREECRGSKYHQQRKDFQRAHRTLIIARSCPLGNKTRDGTLRLSNVLVDKLLELW